jgi:hypothetical protein
MTPCDPDRPGPEAAVFPYASAAAFRTALRDRFATIARAETRYSLDELQRQFAYDRALAQAAGQPFEVPPSPTPTFRPAPHTAWYSKTTPWPST